MRHLMSWPARAGLRPSLVHTTVAVLAVASLAACGGTDAAAGGAGTSVSVVVSGYPTLPSSVVWAVGMEKGYFRAKAESTFSTSEYSPSSVRSCWPGTVT